VPHIVASLKAMGKPQQLYKNTFVATHAIAQSETTEPFYNHPINFLHLAIHKLNQRVTLNITHLSYYVAVLSNYSLLKKKINNNNKKQ
jgi:hypothetical protein